MNRTDELDMRKLEAALRAGDPGRGAAHALSQRGRERVLWSWRHPLLAWCMRHHAMLATAAALVTMTALALWMAREQRAARERQQVPTPISAPVRAAP